MRIQVGIFQNVILQKAYQDEKGRLTLSFRQLGEETKGEVDPFAAMNSSEILGTDTGGDGIILWPFKLPESKTKDGTVRTQTEVGQLANQDVIRLRDQLTFILQQYTTKDKIQWSVFDGAPMTKETYFEDIASQTVLDILYRNISEQFIAMIQPFLDKDEFPMRLKLARQSKEKHFARLPDRYLSEQPFMEPMEVPVDKVKWSKYELDNGLNDGTPISKNTADKPVEDTPEGENVFGQR